MSVITTVQEIAQDDLKCSFFIGTLSELNVDIEQSTVDLNEWIFGFVPPPNVTDRIEMGLIKTKYPFTAYIVKRLPNPTTEYRTQDIQPTIDIALEKARKFVHLFNESDLIEEPTTEVRYPTIYGQFDLHLFGVGIDCEFLVEEGKTGCE